jgi:hypothetical protein
LALLPKVKLVEMLCAQLMVVSLLGLNGVLAVPHVMVECTPRPEVAPILFHRMVDAHVLIKD